MSPQSSTATVTGMPVRGTVGLGHDMFEAMATYVRDYKESWHAAQSLALPKVDDLDHVVFTGMGGSGIGASLTLGLARESSPVPFVAVKDYALPAFVGPRTLVVATSYSGDTEETLFSVGHARDRKAHIVGVASGGALGAFCSKAGLPIVRIPMGRQPRAALPLLFGAVAGVSSKLGVPGFELASRDENLLSNLQVRVHPHPAGADNEALRLAEALRAKTPTIYAEGVLASVALRFKCQLNENAKTFARAETLPESNHNDIVPWGMGKPSPHDHLVLLRRRGESPPAKARFEFLHSVADQARVPVTEMTSQSTSPLGAVLEHLILLDYASVYAAVLQGLDPTPVPIIGALKKRLEKDGWASEARKKLGV